MATRTQELPRSFKGVWLPKEIYLHEGLSWTQKILLVEIDSLDGNEHCFASNAYFANFLKCDAMYISQCISKLTELGLITSENQHGRRILKSNMRQLFTESYDEVPEKKKKEREKFKPPTLLEVVEYFEQHGYRAEAGQKFYLYYANGNPAWTDSAGKPVRSWKQKAQSVWFKPDNKSKGTLPGSSDTNTLNLKMY